MMGFKMDSSSLQAGLEGLMSKSEAAVDMYVSTAALKLQNHMKANRRWTDRTGQARQRLTGKSERTSTGYRIVLAHGVDYGIWLELAREKKYAIIQPTILVKGPEVMEGFKKLIERL